MAMIDIVLFVGGLPVMAHAQVSAARPIVVPCFPRVVL